MIFDGQFVGVILRGKKTVTHRRVDGEQCHWQRGHSYSAQTVALRQNAYGVVERIQETFAHIKVVDVCQGLLGDVTQRDAMAEGFRTTGDFFEWWREKYGDGPLMRVPVWVIRFEVDHDRPRFMAPGGGVQHSHVGAVDENEMVPAAWDKRFSERARVVWDETASMRRSIRERDQRRREQGVRLEDAKRKLRLQGKDFSSKERAAERVIRDLERLADENGDQEAA